MCTWRNVLGKSARGPNCTPFSCAHASFREYILVLFAKNRIACLSLAWLDKNFHRALYNYVSETVSGGPQIRELSKDSSRKNRREKGTSLPYRRTYKTRRTLFPFSINISHRRKVPRDRHCAINNTRRSLGRYINRCGRRRISFADLRENGGTFSIVTPVVAPRRVLPN